MNREVHLIARPRGGLSEECFAVVDSDDPRPQAGQLVVRNRFLSVDPSMRVRMGDDIASYAPPFPLNAPPEGRALGEVVESRAEGYAPGDTVLHMGGWREVSVVDGSAATRIEPRPGVPEEAYLGVLGAPGLTAYVGLLHVGGMREGDTVWVSAAAGAVGSVVGQLARARGAATVIGSAGGPEKVRHLVEDLGFDHAIDHRAGDLEAQLSRIAPRGLDLYFDNVGGRHLEAAFASMKVGGRVAVCGMVAGYSGPDDPPRNLAQIVARRVTVQGFLVLDHLHCRSAFEEEVGTLLAQGRLTWRTTMFNGLDQAPAALAAVLAGTTTGKGIVRV